MSTHNITHTRYVLAVKNLEISACYYEEKLGFRTLWKEGGWQQMARGPMIIMLGECPDDRSAFETRNHSYFAYVEVESIDGLHHELRDKGVDIVYELGNRPWGQREFGIQTVDGHRIMFGEAIT